MNEFLSRKMLVIKKKKNRLNNEKKKKLKESQHQMKTSGIKTIWGLGESRVPSLGRLCNYLIIKMITLVLLQFFFGLPFWIR